MKYCKFLLIIGLLFTVSCVKKTSTPKEYLNQNKVSEEVYFKDKRILKKAVITYMDSVNMIRKPKPKSKILSITIDSVFYNSNNKIVLLAIFKRHNPYVQLLNKPEYQNGIDYKGKCFIATKDTINGSIKIIDRLKYSTGSKESDGYQRVKNKLREIYFQEMNYIDKKYNINDTRFWSSKVWK